MRDIKFRAWVVPDGYFQKETYMAIQGEPDLETLQSFMHHYGDEENLMQYTGLKDKNGKEIYEGDIVFDESRDYGGNKTVVWSEPGACFEVNYKLGHSLLQSKEFLTIIGNIYSNPELLTQPA